MVVTHEICCGTDSDYSGLARHQELETVKYNFMPDHTARKIGMISQIISCSQPTYPDPSDHENDISKSIPRKSISCLARVAKITNFYCWVVFAASSTRERICNAMTTLVIFGAVCGISINAIWIRTANISSRIGST